MRHGEASSCLSLRQEALTTFGKFGNTRYKDIQSYTKIYKDIQRYTKIYKKKYKDIQRYTKIYKDKYIYNIQRYTE